jgi:hypothetical protein
MPLMLIAGKNTFLKTDITHFLSCKGLPQAGRFVK